MAENVEEEIRFNEDWSNGGDGIVVRENVKSVADLRGKTIVLAQNSPSHFFALNALISGGVQPAHWTATVYPGPRRNFVFNAATIWWAQGLASPPGHMLPWSHWSRPHGPDPRVERITANVLRRALA